VDASVGKNIIKRSYKRCERRTHTATDQSHHRPAPAYPLGVSAPRTYSNAPTLAMRGFC
jgi:hypothetical protein